MISRIVKLKINAGTVITKYTDTIAKIGISDKEIFGILKYFIMVSVIVNCSRSQKIPKISEKNHDIH